MQRNFVENALVKNDDQSDLQEPGNRAATASSDRKSFKTEEMSALQMRMNRMKEENKMLRNAVERTMRDYTDLQMKFAVVQENSKKRKDPNMDFLLTGDRSVEDPNEDPEKSIISNSKRASPSREEEDDDDGVRENDELGLSLRVRSSCSKVEDGERNKEKREDDDQVRGFGAVQGHHQTNLPGSMSNMITSPPSKRARVSVRARCEAATYDVKIR
ncbi:UNVERIFIED_CONTAM: putative WRKY transcription factor 9 [Sesamum calycinum]|uniref:WRKY transcription factor 9 n=1 Tax=Sesamum calycinum TaxID=2727403 RepID=A0AAW2JGX8_9LAMI